MKFWKVYRPQIPKGNSQSEEGWWGEDWGGRRCNGGGDEGIGAGSGGGGARAAIATGTTTTTTGLVGPRQGKAMASTAGAAAARNRAAAAAEAAVGLLPRSSLSSHLRGSSVLSFLK